LNLTLLVVHEHLLPSKIKKPMKMFREYRHIYNCRINMRDSQQSLRFAERSRKFI
jgi:hypothetical protein